ncbi:hypothetical protein [Pseudarthrobacter sp. PS3-L1]|uniref:hypothetical protein n=1 Tax=Pseudarthrobacter sp. PS3-L1 TaxID=3046207 RepID=UPI0024BAC4AF|nr:hypothetical protein [Pseudarthrobacter sp. PS3-L1]MDJ0319471.1 hypothetical protein [Pseudarthrobacter sp. PS3-L1]
MKAHNPATAAALKKRLQGARKWGRDAENGGAGANQASREWVALRMSRRTVFRRTSGPLAFNSEIVGTPVIVMLRENRETKARPAALFGHDLAAICKGPGAPVAATDARVSSAWVDDTGSRGRSEAAALNLPTFEKADRRVTHFVRPVDASRGERWGIPAADGGPQAPAAGPEAGSDEATLNIPGGPWPDMQSMALPESGVEAPQKATSTAPG